MNARCLSTLLLSLSPSLLLLHVSEYISLYALIVPVHTEERTLLISNTKMMETQQRTLKDQKMGMDFRDNVDLGILATSL